VLRTALAAALVAWFLLVIGSYLHASLPCLGSIVRLRELSLPGAPDPARSGLAVLGWLLPALSASLVLLTALSSGGYALPLALGPPIHRLSGRRLWETVLGLGLLGTALTGAGFAGLLRRPLLLVLLASGGTMGALRLIRAGREPRGTAPVGSIALFSALGIMALGGQLAGALSPEVEIDSLSYHLGKVWLYLDTGRITAQAWNLSFRLASLWELLLTPAFALGGEAGAKLLNPAVALLAALLVGDAVGRKGPFGGRLATALVLTSLPVAVYAGTLKNDLLVALLATASLVAVLEYRRGGNPRWALVAGALSGFAVATKTTAGLAAAVALALVAWPRRGRASAKPALLFSGAGSLPVLPWLLWNLEGTGNPFFPLATGVFGGLDRFAREMMDQEGYGYLRGDYSSLSGRASAAWSLATRDAFSPLFALALPAAAVLLAGGTPGLWWGAALLLAMALWTAGPLMGRFTIQVIPLSAGAIELASGRLPARGTKAAALALSALMAAETAILWADYSADLPRRALAAVGVVAPSAYREARLTTWAATAEWANANLPRSAHVLYYGSLRCMPLLRRFDLPSFAEPVPFLAVAGQCDGPARMAARLRQYGTTHMVVNRTNPVMWRANLARILAPDRALRTWSAFWKGRASLVHESPRTDPLEGAWSIYDVSGRTPKRASGVILPGIEGYLYIPEALAGMGRAGDADSALELLRSLAGDYAIIDLAEASLPGVPPARSAVLLRRAAASGLRSVTLFARLAALSPSGSGERARWTARAREMDPAGYWRAMEASGVRGFRPAVVPPQPRRRMIIP
jgi:4-amino-4-deoxy-L-arabinose transferase-like glycosyltransferase